MDGLSLVEQALATAGNAAITPDTGAATIPSAHRRAFAATRKRGDPFVLPKEYEPFSVGALGNFPYYWETPLDLSFNRMTYDWVTSGLRARIPPVQLDGVFTNRFINVLSMIDYTLSTADREKLEQAQADATNEQRSLLGAWKSAFRELPADNAGTPPINLIMQVITESWACPPTDLNQLQQAADPHALLNMIPPAGEPVVGPLTKYLATISSSVPLLNQVTKNTGLLNHARAALQNPTAANGAIELSDGKVMPAVSVQTPVSDILEGLACSRSMRLSLEAAPDNNGDIAVSVDGGVGSRMPASQLISLVHPSGGDQLGSVLANSAAPTAITADFCGVTTVSFGPAEFSTAALKNWFWMEPIREAIANGQRDVSGFKFTHRPRFDQFGYVISVLISRNPSITLVVAPSEALTLANTIMQNAQNAGAELSFLGRSLGAFEVPGGYSATAVADRAITLQPAAFAGVGADARAFVLGVKTVFPAG